MSTYATWNPLDKHANVTLSNGNLTAVAGGAPWFGVRATLSKNSGKHYWELTYTSVTYLQGGIGELDAPLNTDFTIVSSHGAGYDRGNVAKDTAIFGGTVSGTPPTAGQIVSIAIDFDAGKIWWGVAGTWIGSGDPVTGANPSCTFAPGLTLFPMVMIYTAGCTANFGASAFGYSVPAGFNPGWYDVPATPLINGVFSFAPQLSGQLLLVPKIKLLNGSFSFSPQLQGQITAPVHNIFSLDSNISFSPQMSGELINSVGASGAIIDIVLPKLQFNAYGGATLNITLPGLRFSAQAHVDAVGRLNITLPRLLFSAHAVQETIGQLSAILPVMQFTAHGIISGIGQLNITLPWLKFEAHGLAGAVGQLSAVLPSLRFTANAYWTSTNTLNITLPKIQFGMRARSNDVIVLVLNTKNFALTEYDNFYNYNSLFNFNGKLVGLKRDGIYELNGDTDNGELIDWSFKTGKFDLEEGQLKKARYVWLSYRPSGDLMLVVDDGETEYEYDVESYKQIDNAVRIKLGKGIRNRYIQLELRNVSNEKIYLDRMRLFTEPIAKKR